MIRGNTEHTMSTDRKYIAQVCRDIAADPPPRVYGSSQGNDMCVLFVMYSRVHNILLDADDLPHEAYEWADAVFGDCRLIHSVNDCTDLTVPQIAELAADMAEIEDTNDRLRYAAIVLQSFKSDYCRTVPLISAWIREHGMPRIDNQLIPGAVEAEVA